MKDCKQKRAVEEAPQFKNPMDSGVCVQNKNESVSEMLLRERMEHGFYGLGGFTRIIEAEDSIYSRKSAQFASFAFHLQSGCAPSVLQEDIA